MAINLPPFEQAFPIERIIAQKRSEGMSDADIANGLAHMKAEYERLGGSIHDSTTFRRGMEIAGAGAAGGAAGMAIGGGAAGASAASTGGSFGAPAGAIGGLGGIEAGTGAAGAGGSWLSTLMRGAAPIVGGLVARSGQPERPHTQTGLPQEIEDQLLALLHSQQDRLNRQTPVHEAAMRLAMQMAPGTSGAGPRLAQASQQALTPRPTQGTDPQVADAIRRLMGGI